MDIIKKIIMIGLLFLFFLPFPFLQNGNAAELGEDGLPKATKVKEVPKKVESHKFSDLKLKGQLKKPELSYIYKRKGLRSEQIVDIPENFNEKILQGAGRF